MRIPTRAQPVQRVGRGRLDRIGDGDDPGRTAVDRDVERGGAVPAQRLRPDFQLAERNSQILHQPAITQCHMPTVHHPGHPFAGDRSQSGQVRPRRVRRSRAAATMAAARGCSLALSSTAAAIRIPLPSSRRSGTIAVTRGLPSVNVPVLSTTSVSTLSSRSSASAERDQHADAGAPLPMADHDRHRRRKAQRAGDRL